MADRLPEYLQDCVVWDNHSCMPLRPADTHFLERLYDVKDVGVNMITLNVAYGRQGSAGTIKMLHAFRHWVSSRPRDFLLVESAHGARAAMESARLGVCFDVEGMDALEGHVGSVAEYYRLGVRWMLAAYNINNAAGGGCLSDDDGLTDFGRQVVSEMNRVGMVVCGSHCGYRTAREMIDHSCAPVIFSHSNARAVRDHPRNIPDDLILACADRGGVIGVNGFGPFLGNAGATVDDLIRHIEHILDLVGEDHVGIGLDYVFDDHELTDAIAADPETFPPDLYTGNPIMVPPWRLPELAIVMSRRGHSVTTIKKVFGGNHLRIAETVWK